MAELNFLRHESVFDPDQFHEQVDVIGAGATGSRIVMSLARLGVKDIHVWDFDKIEEHNVPNQIFGRNDVGASKADAMRKLVLRDTGTKISSHKRKVNGKQPLGEVVFLLTDTMESREEIWKNGIKNNTGVRLMIETRMGPDCGYVYSVNPCLPKDVRAWEKTLYKDEESEESACGATVTVGPTADVLAGIAVWQFIKWFRQSRGEDLDNQLEFEVMYGMRPMALVSRSLE